MFTGIVTDIGEIVSLKPVAQGQLHRLRIACDYDQTTIADGASIRGTTDGTHSSRASSAIATSASTICCSSISSERPCVCVRLCVVRLCLCVCVD